MLNTTPYEILGAPFQLFLAPVGTSFPAIDASPSGSWTEIGTHSNRDFSSDGVKVTHSQTIVMIRPDGTTAPVKSFRTEEDLIIECTIWDVTLEQYRIALNAAAITTTAASTGVAGNKAIGLLRGFSVAQYALIAQGPSPYMDGGAMRFEVPVVIHNGNPAPVFKKGVPAGLVLSFHAMGDSSAPTNQFGTLRAMTAAAT